MEEFRILNPAHNKPVIRASGTERILLPVANVDIFKKNLGIHEAPLVNWQVYKFKRRDRLSRVAKKHGVTMAYLKKVNGIPARRRVRPGQNILVPLKDGAEPYLPDLPAPRFIRVRYYPQPKKKSDQPDAQTSLAPKTRVTQQIVPNTNPLAAGAMPPLEDGFILARQPLD